MEQSALFQQIVGLIAAIHRGTHEMTSTVKPDDVTPLQYQMLEYIWLHPLVTLSEISDCLHISMPNTSRELKKLTEKQLCEKIADNDDRRKSYIQLSPKGAALMGQAFRELEAQFARQWAGASPDELREIGQAVDVLRKIFP
ncbi:MarR family transcriptional regulator [Paenibacillus athensensis]|uniref:MarR family transcriptional regulator n=1 Tax=Paenibacillus athensensis TaxID=1967502 RepID=A0A4Y8PPY6_9BACL|nr:MarR family transcriptional regulator [Paenibacillus athensensis]MCD1258019.1 MarR family transcriptional regulator [Paenibacillus athensensis]